jgi:hypothetical protein
MEVFTCESIIAQENVITMEKEEKNDLLYPENKKTLQSIDLQRP